MAEAVGNDNSKFDWVKERSSCTLPKVFKELRLQVEQDVNARNSMRPSHAPYEFSIKEDVGEFTVSLEAAGVQDSVVFRLSEHAISVSDGEGQNIFSITLTFDDEGKCRLNVNDQPREFWQVRRMALEGLLFHHY